MATDLFVICPFYLETLLLKELAGLGLSGMRKIPGGVYVPQTVEAIYKINYCSRIATRVLLPLVQFPCRDREDLYREAKKIDWSLYLDLKKTFAIDANVISHPTLRNSLFAALIVKDAICDSLREKWGGERPSIDIANPDVQFNLFIQKGQATLSLDTSGAPLYKRGYRSQAAVAPLQENIAAGILSLAHFTVDESLCDPFCGSGTFLIEAALMATHTPPGFFRKSWGFLHLPAFSQTAWEKVKQEADQKIIPLPPHKICGADKDPATTEICRENLKATRFHKVIELTQKDIASYRPPFPPALIISNPPFGKRLETSQALYAAVGKFAKGQGSQLKKTYLLNPDIQLMRATGLSIEKSFPLYTGGLNLDLFSLQS